MSAPPLTLIEIEAWASSVRKFFVYYANGHTAELTGADLARQIRKARREAECATVAQVAAARTARR